MTQASQMEPTPERRLRTKPVRCPYCVDGREFRLMVLRVDSDSHICLNCGHLAMAKNPEFKCRCAKCTTLNMTSRVRPS